MTLSIRSNRYPFRQIRHYPSFLAMSFSEAVFFHLLVVGILTWSLTHSRSFTITPLKTTASQTSCDSLRRVSGSAHLFLPLSFNAGHTQSLVVVTTAVHPFKELAHNTKKAVYPDRDLWKS